MLRPSALLLFLVCLAPVAAVQAQQPFREYPGFEYYAEHQLPPDWEKPGEFVTGRLMYPAGGRFGRRRGGGWENGGTSWAVDYPEGDRTFVQLLRRFSTIDARSVEQPVNPDDADDMGYWPFLMVGLAGYWELSDTQVQNLRNYLLKGGFLFADSFFGSSSWPGFAAGIKRILPEYSIVDLDGSHPVFHTVYDIPALADTQIPNMNSLMGGGGGWLEDGSEPSYPAERVNLGLRLAVNIAVYAMTH